jgi:hypothetical protein
MLLPGKLVREGADNLGIVPRLHQNVGADRLCSLVEHDLKQDCVFQNSTVVFEAREGR